MKAKTVEWEQIGEWRIWSALHKELAIELLATTFGIPKNQIFRKDLPFKPKDLELQIIREEILLGSILKIETAHHLKSQRIDVTLFKKKRYKIAVSVPNLEKLDKLWRNPAAEHGG